MPKLTRRFVILVATVGLLASGCGILDVHIGPAQGDRCESFAGLAVGDHIVLRRNGEDLTYRIYSLPTEREKYFVVMSESESFTKFTCADFYRLHAHAK